MVPTLLVGDRLVADGWAFWKKEPQRGEVIVFDYPKERSTKYVKRVVGIPGDIVALKAGDLYLNGVPVEKNIITANLEPNTKEFRENLNGVEHSIYRSEPSFTGDFGPVTVPEGKLFVLGDNRDRSNDSRYWGFVPRDHVQARMTYIFFSWDTEKKRIRLERMGLQIK